MKIDKTLNLVVPLEHEDGTLYVHSIPIKREVFEKYYLVLSKTYGALWSEGLSAIAGPRVAALLLKTVSENTARVPGSGVSWWDGEDGVQKGLLAEIRRLSNMLVLGANGWETLPLQHALDKKLISEEDISEAENQIVFFTVCSATAPRADRDAILAGGAATSNSLLSYLTPMEFAASLATSSEKEPSGKKATRSSVLP